LAGPLSTVAGQFVSVSFAVYVPSVPSGQPLDLVFSDLGGEPNWVLNGLEIRPGKLFDIGAPLPASLQTNHYADGMTVDRFTVFEGTPGALLPGDLVTVSTDLGTVVASQDVAPSIAGVQVAVAYDGGLLKNVARFDVQRPTSAGTATISLSKVGGDHTGCVSVDYVALPSRRFDFNAQGSPTQQPVAVPGVQDGYLSVSATDAYTAAVGYGWVSPLTNTGAEGAIDRGLSVPLSDPTHVALRRDGHWSNTTRTFQVDLPPGPVYTLNVTLGDALYGRDQVQITVPTGYGTVQPGGDALTGIATAPGRWQNRHLIWGVPSEMPRSVVSWDFRISRVPTIMAERLIEWQSTQAAVGG